MALSRPRCWPQRWAAHTALRTERLGQAPAQAFAKESRDPSRPVDPAGLQAAATQLRTGGAGMAEQADTVVRTWSGLDPYYDAREAPALLAALDPVGATAHTEQATLASAARTLDFFADEARAVIVKLDMLRAAAATASPAAAALLEERALTLIVQLHQAELACAAAIRASGRPIRTLSWRARCSPTSLTALAASTCCRTPTWPWLLNGSGGRKHCVLQPFRPAAARARVPGRQRVRPTGGSRGCGRRS